MNEYLIPANTKNGQLILGMFRKSDLVILISGVITTVAILAFIPITTTLGTILALSPGIICGLLVMPIPYYHNVLNVIIELYDYITSRQTYRWKGWCYKEWLKK